MPPMPPMPPMPLMPLMPLMLQGINLYQDDPDHRNKQIAFIAQNYILNTGRFSEKYSALEAERQQLLPQPNA